jgi:hypothetical protein
MRFPLPPLPRFPSMSPPPRTTGQARAQADEFALLPPLRGGDLGWEYVGRKGGSRNTFAQGTNSALVGDYRCASRGSVAGKMCTYHVFHMCMALRMYVLWFARQQQRSRGRLQVSF